METHATATRGAAEVHAVASESALDPSAAAFGAVSSSPPSTIFVALVATRRPCVTPKPEKDACSPHVSWLSLAG